MDCPNSSTLARLAESVPWLNNPTLTFEPAPDGLSNRTFTVIHPSGTQYVVRESAGDDPVLGIDRAAEISALKVLSDSGLGARLVAWALPEGHLLTEFVPHLIPERSWWSSPDGTNQVAHCLCQLHAIPGSGKRFNPLADIRNRVAWAKNQPHEHANTAPAIQALEDLLPFMGNLANPNEAPSGLCHGDLFRSNLLNTRDGLRLIDLEFAGAGNGWYDLASISLIMDEVAVERLIRAYCGEFNGGHLRTLHQQRLLVAAWDATWALVHLIRGRTGHDYAAHLRESIERLPAVISRIE